MMVALPSRVHWFGTGLWASMNPKLAPGDVVGMINKIPFPYSALRTGKLPQSPTSQALHPEASQREQPHMAPKSEMIPT